MVDTCKSYITIHDDGYICCNICNHEEIINNTGVCECCADNRVEDGIWSIKQRYSNNLRTDINGKIKTT